MKSWFRTLFHHRKLVSPPEVATPHELLHGLLNMPYRTHHVAVSQLEPGDYVLMYDEWLEVGSTKASRNEPGRWDINFVFPMKSGASGIRCWPDDTCDVWTERTIPKEK